MQNIPKIQPLKVKEYENKQSKYEMVPKLPVRSIILGPSRSGKTIRLQNMVLDIYRDCFARIIYFHLQAMLIAHGFQFMNILRNR